jgi:hypothetical protein
MAAVIQSGHIRTGGGREWFEQSCRESVEMALKIWDLTAPIDAEPEPERLSVNQESGEGAPAPAETKPAKPPRKQPASELRAAEAFALRA